MTTNVGAREGRVHWGFCSSAEIHLKSISMTVAFLDQFRISVVQRTAVKDARIVMGRHTQCLDLGAKVPAGQDGDRSRGRPIPRNRRRGRKSIE